MTTTTQPVHVFFVLDRSGSMETIQSDVIGGFNSFVTQQREQAGACRMTLIQFDSHDPHEVIADACPIGEIGLLDKANFVPRGMTPLYDVMGHAIADATLVLINGNRVRSMSSPPQPDFLNRRISGGDFSRRNVRVTLGAPQRKYFLDVSRHTPHVDSRSRRCRSTALRPATGRTRHR